MPRAGFEKKSEYIFLRHREAADQIRFINLNEAAGRIWPAGWTLDMPAIGLAVSGAILSHL